MTNIFVTIFKGLGQFINFLLAHFRDVFFKLWKAKDNIPIKYLLQDTWAIIRSTGMLGVLNIIALLVFTVLPQGKDVLLIIAEEVGVEMRFGNLIFLVIGIFFWSVVSEFACRYTIYVTDNSGKSISEERVQWRKTLQKTMADIFLLLPYIIVLIGFLINYLDDDSLTGKNKNLGFGIPAACIYLLLSGVAHFYLDDERRKILRREKTGLLTFLLLPPRESEWANKLYGIYNDYVFTIRKPSNFLGYPLHLMLQFWENLSENQQQKENFPKSPEVYPGNRVPDEFELLKFSDETKIAEGQFRWIYEIPLKFYTVLHKQLKLIAFASLVLFLAISFLPLSWYDNIGAPGLVVMAFACYTGLYAGLLYLDFALLRKRKILSVRFLLVALLILSSIFNDDHPVRYNGAGVNDTRPGLQAHFRSWFKEYVKDTNTLYKLVSEKDTGSFYPVVFVCAEGGALRTGAFAALTLSFLQDSLATHFDSVDFRKSIYAFSSVSGGSLGVSFYNAASFLSSPQTDFRQANITANTKSFFNEDYLAPVIGKMFYGELINLFIPFSIKRFDRATALEEGWEEGFEKILTRNHQNVFSANYLQLYGPSHTNPALFINTTEVESGLSCWLSNVKTDSGIIMGKQRDLLAYKIRNGINYSTMVNFSSRFPLFSPGATVKQNDFQKFHYVDGGYVENTGCGTMLEIIQALLPLIKENRIRPYVLVLRYNDDKNAATKNINVANEISEILSGIYNTRGGRSSMAQRQLEIFVEDSLHGKVSVLPLDKNGSQVPMNWVLSARSLNQIESDIKFKWEHWNENDLRKFLYFDTTNCIMCKKWPKYFKTDTSAKKNNRENDTTKQPVIKK